MLNTKKTIYIFPDVAYIAEFLPTKKPHTFSVQNFRQINGEFLDENEFIAKNIAKLTSKIEPETYNLVLPDFLFTNTIVEVKETSENKVNQHLKDKLLPDLSLSKETHNIETSILTTYNNTSKVQIAALEKSVLSAFRVSATEKKIEITGITPFSWTLKSIISLEPSISIAQMGSYLYLAQHYIGIDQTTSFKTDQTEELSETIKTLKGAEPNIQTVYLLTNQLFEDKFKELLSDTIPLQQLVSPSEEDNELPAHIKLVLETGVKTFDIGSFPVPTFPLGKPSEKDKTSLSPDSSEKEDEKEEKKEEMEEKEQATTNEVSSELPKPEVMKEEDKKEEQKDEQEKEEEEIEEKKENVEEKEELEPEESQTESEPTEKEVEQKKKEMVQSDSDSGEEDITLEQFAAHSAQETMQETPAHIQQPQTSTSRPVIKNKNSSANMLKMIFITIAVLFITVAIGVGLGLGFLKLSNRDSDVDTTPIVEVESSPEPTTEPSPSPSPSPVAEVDKATIEILVVNATTKAGYAGKIKTQLTADDFENVSAANAKGEYEEGNYILIEKENPALTEAVEAATDLTFTVETTIEDEDPKGEYDAVIVLAE